MSRLRIARRYALSFFEEGKKQKALQKIKSDMQQLKDMFLESREFKLVFSSAIIDAEKKKNIWKKISEKNFHPLTKKFILIVISKRREFFLVDIIEEFFRIYHQENSILHIKICSASLLEHTQLLAIKNKFPKKKELHLSQHIDESLIGGFILQWSNKILDLSLKNRLNVVKQTLLKS